MLQLQEISDGMGDKILDELKLLQERIAEIKTSLDKLHEEVRDLHDFKIRYEAQVDTRSKIAGFVGRYWPLLIALAAAGYELKKMAP